MLTTAHKTTAKPLASLRPSFLFNNCTRHTKVLKRCVPMNQQTTTHTYRCWKSIEAPSPVFQAGISNTGTHVQPVPCEADISTTERSSCTHAAWAVTGPAAVICLGCLDTWELNQCCNSSQRTTYPASLDKLLKCSKAANDTKARESAATPTRKAACSPS